MPKMTPSKQKMLAAKKFAKQLQKDARINLYTAFVAGSVAANMAAPNSDIDLLLVCESSETLKAAIERMLTNPRGPNQTTLKINPIIIERGYFTDKHVMQNSPIGKVFYDGVIPILGKEFAILYRSCWNYPQIKTIKKRYFVEKHVMHAGTERLLYKRRKSARIPHFKRK